MDNYMIRVSEMIRGSLKSNTGSLLTAILLLVSGTSAYGGERVYVPMAENGLKRTLHFTARKLGVPILNATMKMENGSSEGGKGLYRVEARLVSQKVPGFMFRMNNRFTSLMEVDPFCPLRYLKEIDQDGLFIQRKNYSEVITFDPLLHKATVEREVGGEKKEVFFPSAAYDPLSIFVRYHLKERLSPDQELRMSIFDGVKFRQMVFQSKRSSLRSRIFGEVDAVCLESTTTFSSFGEREGSLRIWYSADEHKIPIRLELDLPVGRVTFELEEIRER